MKSITRKIQIVFRVKRTRFAVPVKVVMPLRITKRNAGQPPR